MGPLVQLSASAQRAALSKLKSRQPKIQLFNAIIKVGGVLFAPEISAFEERERHLSSLGRLVGRLVAGGWWEGWWRGARVCVSGRICVLHCESCVTPVLRIQAGFRAL